MTGYTDTIRRWAADLRRAGPLKEADGIGEVGLGEGQAGRRLAVRFALRVDNEVAQQVRFEVFGCGFTIAACAAAADLAEGRPLTEVAAVTQTEVTAALDGLPDERSYCADLAVTALQGAVTSAGGAARPVQGTVAPSEEHAPLVTGDDPLYRALTESPQPADTADEDRHLFACLLSVAAREPHSLVAALGLLTTDLEAILTVYFPEVDRARLNASEPPSPEPPPECSDEVLAILLSHVPHDANGRKRPAAVWLARIIAARAAHPGHLWVAMGLFARPELTAAIRRHLPSLAAANDRKMRWKRYLFKQVCDLGGGVMCKAPDCGVCSDYALCFGNEDG